MEQDKTRGAEGDGRMMAEDPRLRRPDEPPPLMRMLSMVALGVGCAALVTGLLWWVVIKSFGTGPKVFIILAAVCLVYALVVNFAGLAETFRQRRVVTGTNTLVFAALIFGCLVLLNYMAVRHRVFRHDATEHKVYSLSDQTRKVVGALNTDVHLVAFFSPDHFGQREVRDRLEEYAALSPRVKLEVYDPMTRVDKVREMGITTDGTVIVKADDRREEVFGGDEERLTSAVLAVTTGEKTKIYWLTGHGEYDPMDYGPDSATSIRRTLESQQYEVETLALFTEPEPRIPHDCAALVIAGAQHPLRDEEMEAIRKYVDQGGKLFIALANTPNAPDFAEILTPRGVTPLEGKVMDPDARHNAGAPSIPAVLRPEDHETTRRLQGIVLPMARALQVDEGPEPPPSYPGAPPPPGQKATELLRTSSDAYLVELDEGGRPTDQRIEAEAPPLVMAAAIDETGANRPPTPPGMPPEPDEEATGTRIFVVADAEFMTDRLIEMGRVWANAALALNAINWLVGEEKLISIPPREHETPFLTMVSAQKAIAAVMALFIIPGLVILAGGVMWWRRRR